MTLTKFLTLPRTEPIPPVSDDRLERYNRINYLGEIPDGSGRLYVPDMNGMLFVISDGKPAPYLDVGGQVGPAFFSQKGLGSGLSFAAFHPDFARNGKVYTAHTEARAALTGAKPNLGPTPARTVVHSVLTEWTFRDPAAATFDGTRRELMRIGFVGTYHNVQQIGFNPTAKPGDEDYGLLYLAVGDGGAVNTAADDGAASTVPQDLTVPQGKVLRIDPLGTSPGKQYGIPRGNPFAGKPGALGEIYAYGLRDPHRFSWDPEGARSMLLGSIGEDNVESIYDVRPGDNFGWSEREGPFAVQPERNCLVTELPADDRRGFVYPVAAYGHTIPPGDSPVLRHRARGDRRVRLPRRGAARTARKVRVRRRRLRAGVLHGSRRDAPGQGAGEGARADAVRRDRRRDHHAHGGRRPEGVDGRQTPGGPEVRP